MDNLDTLATLGTKVDPTNNIIPGLNRSAFEGQAVLVSYKTSVLVIVKSGKSFVRDRGKKNICVKERKKIHCQLRNGYFVAVNQILMTTVMTISILSINKCFVSYHSLR
jgi:hypothetical protein